MRVYHNLPVPSLDAPSNLSIGNFDGVHLGHQALLRAMAVDAHQRGRQAGLLTFDPHPATVLRPHSPQPYLTTIAERLAVLRDVGLDFVVVYPFTLETARTPAASFIARLKDALHLGALWVGPDFALGRNREGDVDSLRVLGETTGFTVHTIDPQIIGGDEVRSGRIRQHLQEGQVEIAAQLAGPALSDQRHRGGWRAPRPHHRLPDRQPQRAAGPASARQRRVRYLGHSRRRAKRPLGRRHQRRRAAELRQRPPYGRDAPARFQWRPIRLPHDAGVCGPFATGDAFSGRRCAARADRA